MPVQINEVIIRTTVDAGTPQSVAAVPNTNTASQEDTLERILQIIEEEKER
ncbi:MAG: hypothetical protein JSS75_00705 [Bacteroidetes bacterium]|nr:hypothetical protein [Bacteroidota bacterium]